MRKYCLTIGINIIPYYLLYILSRTEREIDFFFFFNFATKMNHVVTLNDMEMSLIDMKIMSENGNVPKNRFILKMKYELDMFLTGCM